MVVALQSRGRVMEAREQTITRGPGVVRGVMVFQSVGRVMAKATQMVRQLGRGMVMAMQPGGVPAPEMAR